MSSLSHVLLLLGVECLLDTKANDSLRKPCSSGSFNIQVSNILMHTVAAAGIASAFGAPVCDLLFAMEEVFFVCGKTSFRGKVCSVAQPCN